MGTSLVRKKTMRNAVIIPIGMIILLINGCGGNQTKQIESAPPVLVRTEKVEKTDFPQTILTGGTLRGDRQTVILSKVTSTIIDIPVRIGQTVVRGDLLVKLDPGGVTSQLNQAQAVYENAQDQYGKMKQLYEAGAVSEMQLETARTAFLVAEANYEAARRGIEVEAPFDGVVVDIPVRLGSEVASGMPLVEVADVTALRLILEVPTTQAGLIRKGQKVRIISPQDTAKTLTGEVLSVADAANRDTRGFEVECRFSRPGPGFAPGMYVPAEVEIKIFAGATVVPNEAILYRSGRAYLYAVAADTAMLVPIEVMASGEGRTAVSGPLVAGQPVVVVGHKNLTPGALVQEAGQ